jgi:hypothetical protein
MGVYIVWEEIENWQLKWELEEEDGVNAGLKGWSCLEFKETPSNDIGVWRDIKERVWNKDDGDWNQRREVLHIDTIHLNRGVTYWYQQ